MGLSGLHWIWLAALSCLLMGGEVWCDCTDVGIGIQGGTYTLTNGLQRGSKVIYQCPPRFYPHPVKFRICEINDRWEKPPKTFQPEVCKMVECPNPHVLLNGIVLPGQEKYFVGNKTTIECYSGYTMRGSSERVCLHNGKWSGTTPVCSRDSGSTCADPGIPPGGTRIVSGFRRDDKITYSCPNTMFLMGSQERVCMENGQWTGNAPECYYKYTYDTPLEASRHFGGTIKESLTILESTGVTQGERTIRIDKDSILDIYIAVDISESIRPEDFDAARNATLKLMQKIGSFDVSPNYDIMFFSSEIYEVVSILNYVDGKVNRNTMMNDLRSFTIEDKSTGTDLNQVFESISVKMAAIKERYGENFKDRRHAVILFTDGAYNTGGSPDGNIRKIKNTVYLNPTTPEERKLREEYLDIYVFGIGLDIFDEDLIAISVGLGGRHYYKMDNIKDLQKTFDEMINEGDVKGLCGLHKDYVTTDLRDQFPWYAEIFTQFEGKQYNCLGALVSPSFVITGAHCFPFGTKASDIRVEIDDGNGIVKEVLSFAVHDDYNITLKIKEGIDEYYDNDVALLQLKDYVEFSTTVRPICIPCTTETRRALQLPATSTCTDQESLLLKDHIEKLYFLTRRNTGLQAARVHAKLGTNRGDCIKQALNAKGVRTKDPTKVVTDKFLCTGGVSPYVDHLSCKGDSGGAVFKHYYHRTVQVALVSWGTQNLCKDSDVPISSDKDSRDFHLNLFKVVPFLRSILGKKKQAYEPLEFVN